MAQRLRVFVGGAWVATIIGDINSVAASDDVVLYVGDIYYEWNGHGWEPVTPSSETSELYLFAVEAEEQAEFFNPGSRR